MEKVVELKSIMQILCVERVHRLPVELIDELPNATKPINKSIMIKVIIFSVSFNFRNASILLKCLKHRRDLITTL
jgi:hypothetical protein